jgi:hypothetical protein
MENIESMLKELREKNLTYVCVGFNSWCEAFIGSRTQAFQVVESSEEFENDINNMLLLVDENGSKFLENNIEYAYNHI